MLSWLASNPSTAPVIIHDARGWAPDCLGSLAHPDARYRNLDEFRRRGIKDGRLKHRVNLLYECEAEDAARAALGYVRMNAPALLAIDELDRLPSQLTQKHAAYAVLHYGARAGVSIFGSARAPQHIDKAWLGQADEIVCFQLSTRQVLQQIEQFGTPEARGAVAALPNLPPYHYVIIRS